jgi:hypothetical protein
MDFSRLSWIVILLIVFPYDFLPQQSHYALAKAIYTDQNASGDGFLDAEDLFFFSMWWQQPTNETSYPCDFVPDGVINETDLLTLFRAWRPP